MTLQRHETIGVIYKVWPGRCWYVTTEPVREIEQRLGGIEPIHDECGHDFFDRIGLCPECIRANNADGCGRHFVVAYRRVLPSKPVIIFQDDSRLVVDKIGAFIYDNGVVIRFDSDETMELEGESDGE